MRTVLTLWRAEVRRDRVQVPIWLASIALLALLGVVGVTQSYGTVADRKELLATVIANPVILTFRGLPSGTGTGEFVTFLVLPFLVMVAAFMSSFLAVRHTRAEEESGRAELVGSTEATRSAILWATVMHAVLTNVASAVLVALAFIASGLDPASSGVAGLAVGLAGAVFFAIALVCAQVFATARAANSASVSIMLLLFLCSGLGNALGTPSADLTSITSSPLTWVSPYGWAENTRPFQEDAMMPLLLAVIVAAGLIVLAGFLQGARDLGASLAPERRGRATASATLRGPISLAARLTWTSILGWAIGGFLTGALATSLASVVQDMGSANPAVKKILDTMSQNADLQAGTVVIFFTVVGILAACCAIQVMVRARQEEARGTVEPMWAAPVGRRQWLSSYLVVGACGIISVLAAAVLGSAAGLAKGGNANLMSDVWVGAYGQGAAAGVFLVIAALLVVLVPRLTVAASWGVVALAAVLGLFGPLFGIPQWLTELSPIAQTPTLTATGVDQRGLWGMCAIVIVSAVAALLLVRRRPLVLAG